MTASSAAFVPDWDLSQGTHTVAAQVADLAGNSAGSTSTFLVDSLPPVTTMLVNGLPAGSTTLVVISTESLGFAATDGGAGVLETRYALDASTVEAVLAAVTIPVSVKLSPFFSNLANFAARLDAAGVAATLYYGEGLVHGCLRGRGQVAEVDLLYETLLGFLADRL